MRGFAILLTVSLTSCHTEPDPCPEGEIGCECSGSVCVAGLSCVSGVCQMAADSSSDGASSEEMPGSSEVDDSSSGDSESTETVTGSTDAPCSPPEIACGDGCIDPLTDNANCGGCGNPCIVEDEYGTCVSGMCSPTLSSCVAWDMPLPCSDVCSESGMVCMPQGCGGATYIYYDDGSACSQHAPNGASADPCTEPSFAANGAYRCCCAQ